MIGPHQPGLPHGLHLLPSGRDIADVDEVCLEHRDPANRWRIDAIMCRYGDGTRERVTRPVGTAPPDVAVLFGGIGRLRQILAASDDHHHELALHAAGTFVDRYTRRAPAR